MQVRIAPGEDVIPVDLLGPLRFFHALHMAARVRLLAGAEELFSGQVAPAGEIPSGSLELVEALARIQEATGVFFALPRGLTVREVQAILTADELLRNGQVVAQGGRATLVLTRQQADELLRAFPSGQIALWQPSEPFAIRVGGHEVALGPVSIHSPSAQFDADALRAKLARQLVHSDDQLVQLPVIVHASNGPMIRLVA